MVLINLKVNAGITWGTIMCTQCQLFLYDFLLVPPHKDLPFAKEIRVKNLLKILPEFVTWSTRIHAQIKPEEFDTAIRTASRIARRGRSLLDYECLIHTSTSNFLKHTLQWLPSELEYMKLLLIEVGVINGKKSYTVLHTAQDYLNYVVPRMILILRDLHDDHANPKGLYTDLGKLYIPKQTISDNDTCYDRDDYQKEILTEVDLDDLYT